MIRLGWIIGILALADLALLISGTRVLVNERLVPAGHAIDGRRDEDRAGQAALVCTYFTGRSLLKNVYWYSPANVFGRDECPFLLRQGD